MSSIRSLLTFLNQNIVNNKIMPVATPGMGIIIEKLSCRETIKQVSRVLNEQ